MIDAPQSENREVVASHVPSEGVDANTKQGKTDSNTRLGFLHPDRSSDRVLVRCFLLESLWCRDSGNEKEDITDVNCHRCVILSYTPKSYKGNNHGDQGTPSNEPVSTSVI